MHRRMILLVAVATVVAACGGSANADTGGVASLEGGDSATSTSTTVAVDQEQALMDFAQCMRDNGITTFPDPQVSSDGGGITLRRPDNGGDLGFDPQSQEFRDAMDACRSNLDGVAFGPGGQGGGGFDPAELQDQLLAMAQCLRDAGFQADDPQLDFGGGGGGVRVGPGDGNGGPFGPDFDMSDPAAQEAMSTCADQIGFQGPRFGARRADGPGGQTSGTGQ